MCSRVSTAGKHDQIADGHMRWGRADSAEGVGAQSGKGAHSTYDGNPLVDVRTGAGHADVRLSGLWNRHVWKKDTRDKRGSVY